MKQIFGAVQNILFSQMQILQFFSGEIAERKASAPKTGNNKDPVHWDSAFAIDLT